MRRYSRPRRRHRGAWWPRCAFKLCVRTTGEPPCARRAALQMDLPDMRVRHGPSAARRPSMTARFASCHCCTGAAQGGSAQRGAVFLCDFDVLNPLYAVASRPTMSNVMSKSTPRCGVGNRGTARAFPPHASFVA